MSGMTACHTWSQQDTDRKGGTPHSGHQARSSKGHSAPAQDGPRWCGSQAGAAARRRRRERSSRPKGKETFRNARLHRGRGVGGLGSAAAEVPIEPIPRTRRAILRPLTPRRARRVHLAPAEWLAGAAPTSNEVGEMGLDQSAHASPAAHGFPHDAFVGHFPASLQMR